MGRPFVGVTLVYVCGLLLAHWLQPPLVWLFSLIGGLLLPALLIRRWQTILVWPLLLLLGWVNSLVHTQSISPNDLRCVVGRETIPATIQGRLLETPRLKVYQKDAVELWRSVARVEVSAIATNHGWQPAVGIVLVTTPDIPPPEYFTGQPVEITGVIAPPPGPRAEGLFDFRDYLATRGIYYQLKTMDWSAWHLPDDHAVQPPLADRFLHWAKGVLSLGLPVEDESLRLLWAMTLDWRTAFTGDISEPFLQAGTMHLFAIDGLRIALLAGAIVTLLRALRLSRAWCGLVAVPIIWFYTAATGWEASAIRASVMMSVILGGWALQRPSDLLNSLAAAAFILLWWDPGQWWEAGFQLSFSVVAVIAVMLPRLNGWIYLRLRPDPLLPESMHSPAQRLGFTILQRLARYLAMSFTAWIGSLPFCAKYFHLFNPVSTLANLFAVPLGTLALIANLGALICGNWLTGGTVLFNEAAWFCMSAMVWVSREFARLPGAYWYVGEPSICLMALYYLTVLGGFGGWFVTRRRQLLGGIVWLLLAVVCLSQWIVDRHKVTITVLPLDRCPALFVDSPLADQRWLINAGDTNDVQATVKPFLQAHGVNHLPHVMLTDGSITVAGGVPVLDPIFRIAELWTSPGRFRSGKYSDIVDDFAAGRNRHHVLQAGQTVGGWQVLHPLSHTGSARVGDDAVVLLGQFYNTKVLFLSDLSRSGQDDLLASANDLAADIVITGITSSGEPLCDELIHASRPKIIIVTDTEFPVSNRAKPTLKDRLAQSGIPIIYTDTSDAVTMVMDAHGCRIRTMDGQVFTLPAGSSSPPHIAPAE